MTKKKIGHIKLIWTCPRCSTRNPGPNKFCNGCGAPQPEDVQFEQPAEAELIKDSGELARAKAGPDIHCPYCGTRNPAGVKFCGACGGDLVSGVKRQTGRVVGAYRAPSGAARPCPACGTPNPLTSVKCSNCGSALPAEETAPAPTPPRAVSSRTPLLIGGAVGLLCLLAIVAGFFALRQEEHAAVVRAVAWERTIDIEAMGPAEHSDWEENVPSEARDLSCDLEYRTTQPDPAPRSTEVCGTPYTVDDGSGYGEVVQDCEYRVYDEMCTYTVDEWVVVETLRRSGSDLNPFWPDVRLAADQRQGKETESYTVSLASNEDVYSYAPASPTEFAAFLVGSEWTITVNGLGSVVGVEAAP